MTPPFNADTVHPVRRVPGAFWHWWTAELAGMVPGRWRKEPRLNRPYLLLSLRGDESILKACMKSGDVELGKAGVDREAALEALDDRRYRGWPVIVALDDALGLSKVVDLPLVGDEDIERLLYYELDRLTPFKADDVCFAWRVVERTAGSGRLMIRLELAPKALIEEASALLRSRGREPARVQLQGEGERLSLDLMPQSPRKTGRGRVPGRLLPLLVIGLAILAVAMPMRQQHLLIQRLDAEVEAARRGAEESAGLREQITRLADQANFLIDARRQRIPVTTLLAALTRLIPDHAYISQLSIQQGEVTFVGQADKASDLLATLEASPIFAAPRFRSPVTRDPRTQKERFQIAVDVVLGKS